MKCSIVLNCKTFWVNLTDILFLNDSDSSTVVVVVVVVMVVAEVEVVIAVVVVAAAVVVPVLCPVNHDVKPNMTMKMITLSHPLRYI